MMILAGHLHLASNEARGYYRDLVVGDTHNQAFYADRYTFVISSNQQDWGDSIGTAFHYGSVVGLLTKDGSSG